MTRPASLRHQFVDAIPEILQAGVLYVSMRYRTAVHLCPSGCGEEVVTPLGRDDWSLIFDGRVSLRPSVGNWGLACRSHYWVTRDEAVWARAWSRDEIDRQPETAADARLGARPPSRGRLRAWLMRLRGDADRGDNP